MKKQIVVIVILILCTGAFSQTLIAQDKSPDPLVVCLLGDPQLIMVERTPEYVDYAMKDIAGLEHDFIAVLGDLAQNRAHFYKDYNEAVVDKAVKPVFSLAGNGDVGAGLEAYKEGTGLPLYYSFKLREIRFIFLSTMYYTGEFNHICNLGEKQLKWLRKELRSDTLSTTIVFSHPPLFETTYKSEFRDHIKAPGSMYLGESLELKEMFRNYRNVKIFAHGHLHITYGKEDDHGRGGYCLENGLLNVSVGGTAQNKGSSFLVIEKNRITLKVRNHEKQLWLDEYEYSMGLPGTLNNEKGEAEKILKMIKN